MFGLSFKIESKSCVLRFIVLGTLSRISWFILEDDDLNLNSLLVKRQIDNPSPGAVTGGN